MLKPSPETAADVARYKKAAMRVYDYFGSYENLAQTCYARTGERTAANTLRRWLQNRNCPVQYVTVFVDITEGAVHLFDFYPWLKPYVRKARKVSSA